MSLAQHSYETLTSRNMLYLSDELQKKIRGTRLAFLGVGLCSSIVEDCVRLGFERFYLQDYDKIELSNLNRQSYFVDEVGSLKVEAIRRRILAINPACQLTCASKPVGDSDEMGPIVDQHDIVISTIDCSQAYFDVIACGRERGKLVLCPFNPGFSGFLIVFGAESCPAEEVFDLSGTLNEENISKQVLDRFPELNTLKNVDMTSEEFINVVRVRGYFPQMVIGAALTSALVLTTIVRHLSGLPLRMAPEAYYLNTL